MWQIFVLNEFIVFCIVMFSYAFTHFYFTSIYHKLGILSSWIIYLLAVTFNFV